MVSQGHVSAVWSPDRRVAGAAAGRIVELCALTSLRAVIFLVGLCLFSRSSIEVGWDLTVHLAAAKSFAAGHSFAVPSGQPLADRPVVVLLLATILTVTNYSLSAVMCTIYSLHGLLGMTFSSSAGAFLTGASA